MFRIDIAAFIGVLLVDKVSGFSVSIPSLSRERIRHGLRASLTFSAQVNTTSDPIEDGAIEDYFICPTFLQNFCASDESAQVLPLSDDHRQLWTDVYHDEAYRYDPELAPPPLPVNSTYKMATMANKCSVLLSPAKSQFPGLTVVNNLMNGVQFCPADGMLPMRYSLILLSDTRTATGARFAVWLFNQLSNPRNSTESVGNDDARTRPSCRAVTTISLCPYVNEEGVAKGHCLHVKAEVSVTMQVPKLLLKVIPMSLERAEAVGSESMQKTVAADIASGIERTIKAVLDARHVSEEDGVLIEQ